MSEFKYQVMMTALGWRMIIERFYNKESIYHILNLLHLFLWNKPVSADCGLPLQIRGLAD